MRVRGRVRVRVRMRGRVGLDRLLRQRSEVAVDSERICAEVAVEPLLVRGRVRVRAGVRVRDGVRVGVRVEVRVGVRVRVRVRVVVGAGARVRVRVAAGGLLRCHHRSTARVPQAERRLVRVGIRARGWG